MQRKQTILEWYRSQYKKIDAPCGGNGTCGKCKVRFHGRAKEACEAEKAVLSQEEIQSGIRLACMTEMTDEARFSLVGELFENDKIQRIMNEDEDLQDAEYGVAIDIGSTTLVMCLLNLTSGRVFATLSALNPQRAYGADIMSRMKSANEGELPKLQAILHQALRELFEELISVAKVDKTRIRKIAIVGNTTMLHLLQGFSCETLSVAPFTPVDISMRKIKAGRFDRAMEETEIIILPCISAFVGADVVAGIYACDMDLSEETQMLVDVGTNGEMVIGDKMGFLVTSTAAGPVFEGGKICCGMPAVNGGVVHLARSDRRKVKEDTIWSYQSIGSVKPCGICGSGLIDLAAELVTGQVLDENGTLEDRFFEDGYELRLLYQGEKVCFRITQSDIRELQMGKSAIRAGMECLLDKRKTDNIYLAGAFGNGLDVVKSRKIGLFSHEMADRIQLSGNTALDGAKKFLCDAEGETRIRQICVMAKEFLLTEETQFFERYIQYMQFDE